MALGLNLSSFLKLPGEFRYPVLPKSYTSFVIIKIGAKTINEEVKADKWKVAECREGADPLHRLNTHQPALTSTDILLPTSKEGPAAQFASTHQSIPPHLPGGHRDSHHSGDGTWVC